MKKTLSWQTLLATAFSVFAVAVQAADRYWVATAPGDWSDTANWATSSGGVGPSSVPGVNDTAIFDGGGTGDCTIDVNVNVGGISITAGYDGEISQGAQEVLVGTDDFTQAGGTYTCGTGELKVSAFRLDGGTFTAPSSLLAIDRGSTGSREIVRLDPASATFNHNGGRVRLELVYSQSSSSAREFDININGGIWTVYDLDYMGGDTHSNYNNTIYRLGASDTIVVLGDLTMSPRTDTAPTARLNVNRGRHRLQGNLTLGNEHTPAADSRAGLQFGTTVVEFMGAGDQTITSHPTHSRGPVVEINKDTGKVSTATGFDDVAIGGLILTKGTFEMPAGATLTFDISSSASLTIVTRDSAATTFDASHVDIVFDSGYSNSGSSANPHDIKLDGTLAVSNLTFSGGNTWDRASHPYRLQAGDTFEVGGDLLIRSGRDGTAVGRLHLAQGAIDVRGNVVIGNALEPGTGSYGDGYGVVGTSTDISLVGSDDQTILHNYPGNNQIPSAAFTINKTGGTATLLSNVTLGRSNQDLLWTAGGLDLGTNTLTVNRNVTIDPGATTLGVTVADATTAGNIVAGGNASAIDNVDLVVTVTASQEDVDGETYVVLANNTALAEPFASVSWVDSTWRGTVDYDSNQVTLSELIKIPAGTVIRFR